MPESITILRHPNYEIYPEGVFVPKTKIPENKKTYSPLLSANKSESRLFEAPDLKAHKFKLKARNLNQKPLNLRYMDNNFSEPPSTKWRYQQDFEDSDTD